MSEVRRMMRFPEVMQATGYSRATIYEKIKNDPSFPKPVKLSNGGKAVGWFDNEFIAYQELLAARREGGE
jgi:prophage regulatory protein